MKKTRFYMSLSAVLALIAGFCFIPFPYSIYAPAVVELRSDEATTANVLAPKSGGVLTEILVEDGDLVKAGDVLARLKNPRRDAELVSMQGQRRETERELQMCEQLGANQEAVARLQELKARLVGVRKAIQELQAERKQLELRAPIDGVVVSPYWRVDRENKYEDMSSALRQWEGTPLSPRNLNVTLEPGTHVCSVGDPSKLEAIVVVDQSKIDFVEPGRSVKIKLTERPSETIVCQVNEIDDVERQKMENAPFQLSAKGGGPIATETVEGGEERPQSASFRVRVDLDSTDELEIKVGMTAKAKIKARPQTLLQRLARLVREVFNFKL